MGLALMGAWGTAPSPAGTSTRAWGAGSSGPMGARSSGWFDPAELRSSHKTTGRDGCQASAFLTSSGTQLSGFFPFSTQGIPLVPTGNPKGWRGEMLLG